jgi:Skp family chaperone for outer membrane proteins
MNGKTAITGVLIGVVALGAALQYGRAASPAPAPSLKIGLVSIRDVFNGSKKYAQYQAQRAKRRSEASAKLDELTKQLAKEEGDLKQTLVPGTADYLKQLQIVVELRAKLQAQQELIKQQQMIEDKEWLEGLYQEALKATATIAKERGLDLVLERTEPKFPMASEEVFSVISTHKVLYCGACIDLTSEVLTRVDATAGLQP